MYTVEDFKNGLVIIDNKTSPNPAKIREIINSNFRIKASGNAEYYIVDQKTDRWIAGGSTPRWGNLPVQNVNDFQIPSSRKTEANEIPTQPVKTLNVGDTYEFRRAYRIISSFENGLFRVSNRQGIGTGTYTPEELLKHLDKDPDFTNYKSVLLTNNNNQNEKTGKTSTVDTGKRTESSISSSSARQVASASRLIGDATHGKCKETRIGRIEISSSAISF